MRAPTSSRLTRAAATALSGALLMSAAAAPSASAGLIDPLLGVTTTLVDSTLDTTSGLLTGADWGYAPGATSMTTVAAAIGADDMWARGYTGRGIGVALIDTGLVPVPGLTSGNVVNGPDLSFDSQGPSPHLDAYGHGTHMAGIIAGNDGAPGGFTGIAPHATLLNMKVAAHDGAADVSQVIAAVDWVVEHRNDPGLGIRVLNLSYGTDGVQSPTLDPLTHAIENAWRAGIVVVVSGGNAGRSRPSLDNPARDPYVIAVGADDLRGTTAYTGDDVVPSFSSRGSSARRVDIVAPGQSVVSLRNPGSYIDSAYPGAVVDQRFFKGSGTSGAAAVVSGAAALLLQQRPTLTPDDVKSIMTRTAKPLLLADADGRGSGLLDVAAASFSPRPLTSQKHARSTGLGTLEGARGTDHVGDRGADLTGERDIFGKKWTPSVWAPASSAGTAWSLGVWNGNTWTGSCWCGSSWSSRTWSSRTWSSRTWSSRTWSSTDWDSRTWSSRSWSGEAWSSRTWSSRTWSGSSWASVTGADE